MNQKILTITRLDDSGENKREKWLWIQLEFEGRSVDLRFDFDPKSGLWNLGSDNYFGNEADDVDLALDFDSVWKEDAFTKTIFF